MKNPDTKKTIEQQLEEVEMNLDFWEANVVALVNELRDVITELKARRP